MYSFYGGKQGISFIIVKHYDSVQQMLDCFAQGGLYTEVNYGEYVLIDTIANLNKKSSIENGLVYRRGYRYDEPFAPVPSKDDYRTEDGYLDEDRYEHAMNQYFLHPGAGAEYIGKIVGPQGETPKLEVLKESEVKELIEKNNEGYAGTGFSDIVSGKDQKVLSYAYCNMRDEDYNIIGCAIAFTAPYHFFEMNANSVSAYTGVLEDGQWYYDGLITKESGNDDEDPYRSTWHIDVPKGIHGTNIDSIGADPNPNKDNLKYQYYYELRDFLETEEGKVTRTYLDGIYHKMIENIELDEEASDLIFNYLTGESDRVRTNYIKEVGMKDFQLLVYYSDPDLRQLLIEAGKATSYNGKDGWLNLGNVRGAKGGILVAGYVPTVDDLPVGGPPEGYKGWFYEVEGDPTTDEDNRLYGYDYIGNTGWFPVPSLSSPVAAPEAVSIIAEPSEENPDLPAQGHIDLNINGIWFVVTK